jgi:hypothetical protein
MSSRLFVFFSFCLAAGVLAYFLGSAFVQRHKASPNVVSEASSSSSSSEEVSSEVESEEPIELEPATSYEVGYDRGYRAFLEQQGVAIPVLKVARYATSLEGELDEEQASRGYADGYHRAGESLHCPR